VATTTVSRKSAVVDSAEIGMSAVYGMYYIYIYIYGIFYVGMNLCFRRHKALGITIWNSNFLHSHKMPYIHTIRLHMNLGLCIQSNSFFIACIIYYKRRPVGL
jgi:hypothetical protein